MGKERKGRRDSVTKTKVQDNDDEEMDTYVHKPIEPSQDSEKLRLILSSVSTSNVLCLFVCLFVCLGFEV